MLDTHFHAQAESAAV